MIMKAKLFLFVFGLGLLASTGWAATIPGSFQVAESNFDFCQHNYNLCLESCDQAESCINKCQVDYQNCMSR